MKKFILNEIYGKLFLFLFLVLPHLAYNQNVVLNVTGKVHLNGQPVKKGDNLSNTVKLVFEDVGAELKLLTQTGVCVIKFKNYEQKNHRSCWI